MSDKPSLAELASNRRPSLEQRRAALGLSSLSVSERRENIVEALDDLTSVASLPRT